MLLGGIKHDRLTRCPGMEAAMLRGYKGLLRSMIFLALLFFACGKDDTVQVKPDNRMPLSEQLSTSDEIVAQYSSLLESHSTREARRIILDELKATANVSDASISADSITVCWHFTNGMIFCFLTETRVDSLIDDGGAALGQDIGTSGVAPLNPLELPHNRKAMVLSPYKWSLPSPCDESGDVRDRLSSIGYATTYASRADRNASSLSLDDYRKFGEYGVIAITTHSGFAENIFMICSGVLVPQDIGALKAEYRDDWVNYRLIGIKVTADSTEPWTFAFRPSWITKYYPAKLQRTLFYLGSCSGLKDPAMANAILGSGSIYFGWNSVVYEPEATNAGKDLFYQLAVAGSDCGDAYLQVLENGNGKPLPARQSASFLFLYQGNQEIYLVERPCDDFPPPAGESWTYQVVGSVHTFTAVTEHVTEQVGGYTVYRLSGTDSPAGLGEYYACDEDHGEVEVATDWWELGNPDNHGRIFFQPPLYGCQYGDAVGTVIEWVGTFGGSYERDVSEVLAYETVTVPFGTFENAMKLRITMYDSDGIFDEPLYFWFDSSVGLVRGEEVDGGEVFVLTAYSTPTGKSAGASRAMVSRSTRGAFQRYRALDRSGRPENW